MYTFKYIFTYRNLLWLLIIIGESIHFIIPFIYNPIDAIWSDPGRWWEYGSALGIETPPLALMDPLFYQAWLSFVAKFTLDIPLLTALYAGLLSAITPWIWYRFLRELLATKERALLGWAIFSLLPSWIGIYSYFMTETLLLTLMGLSLWASWRSLRKKDVSSFIVAVLFWIPAGLTRAIAAPIGAAIMVFVWWQQSKKFKSLSIATLLVACVLASLSYRSYERSGMMTPLGQPYLNEIYAKSGKKEIIVHYFSENSNIGFQYGFQCPSMGTPIFSPFSDWISSRTDKVVVKINLDKQHESWQAALQKISTETSERPSTQNLLQENVMFLFFGPSWPDMNEARFFEKLNTDLRFIWLPLFLLSLFLLIRGLSKRHSINHLPLLSALIVWFLLQGLFLISVNEGRYRKPIEGIIIVSLLLAIPKRQRTSVDEIKS